MKLKKLNKGFWSFTLKALVVAGIITCFCIFLITNREIAIALTPWATLLLAFAAFWAIWQNYQFKKQERKERLLNEIIEWAEDVSECVYKNMIIRHDQFIADHIKSLALNLYAIQTRSSYINTIASAKEFHFGRELIKAVEGLQKDLKEHIKLLMRWQSVINEEPQLGDEYGGEAAKHRIQLDESVVKVIEEAAKIKTEILS